MNSAACLFKNKNTIYTKKEGKAQKSNRQTKGILCLWHCQPVLLCVCECESVRDGYLCRTRAFLVALQLGRKLQFFGFRVRWHHVDFIYQLKYFANKLQSMTLAAHKNNKNKTCVCAHTQIRADVAVSGPLAHSHSFAEGAGGSGRERKRLRWRWRQGRRTGHASVQKFIHLASRQNAKMRSSNSNGQNRQTFRSRIDKVEIEDSSPHTCAKLQEPQEKYQKQVHSGKKFVVELGLFQN